MSTVDPHEKLCGILAGRSAAERSGLHPRSCGTSPSQLAARTDDWMDRGVHHGYVPGSSAAFLSWLTTNAQRSPDKVFVHSIDQDRIITHAEMLRLCRQIGSYLAEYGIRANDRVALLSHNSIEHLAAYFGIMAYGATACTIHVEMNVVHLPEVLRAVNPQIVLFARDVELADSTPDRRGRWMPLGTWRYGAMEGFYKEVTQRSEDRDDAPVNTRDDVASIFFTSGTEAKPRGVLCSFGELVDNTEATADAFGITSSDRVLESRSFNWMSAQVLGGLSTLYKGATLIVARKFSQSQFFRWVQEHRATIATGNPTTINMLLNRPVNVQRADIPDLRFITSSSAPLLVEDWKAFEQTYGIPIAQGYGSSETGWIAGSDERTRRLGSVGKPFAYQNVAVVGEANELLPPGEVGAIELGRGTDAEYRYLGDDGTIQVRAKGRINTGDMGYVDEDGYLYLTGRAKDLIIRGGVNIAPVEIDNIICEIPDVAEAATVGVPDRIWGEELVAYVRPKPGSGLVADDVLAHCRARLSEAKVPKEVILRSSLPKTDRGKLDRSALAEEWARTQRP